MAKDKDKILEIIQNSGNDLHFKVAKFFEEKGWEVTKCQYYSDPITGKPREIDILAEKYITVKEDNISSNFKLHFFIDCKFIKNPIVLWFDPKNLTNAQNLALNNFVFRRRPEPERKHHLNSEVGVNHYIIDSEVAKLTKGEGYDVFFDAATQTLHSLLSLEKSNEVDYPIIVVDSFKNLFKREHSQDKGYTHIIESFQLEMDYSFKGDSRYFLIDIVSVDKLGDFIDNFEKNDLELLKRAAYWSIGEQEIRERQRKSNTWKNSNR